MRRPASSAALSFGVGDHDSVAQRTHGEQCRLGIHEAAPDLGRRPPVDSDEPAVGDFHPALGTVADREQVDVRVRARLPSRLAPGQQRRLRALLDETPADILGERANLFVHDSDISESVKGKPERCSSG
jgi:hypothetical protein